MVVLVVVDPVVAIRVEVTVVKEVSGTAGQGFDGARSGNAGTPLVVGVRVS